MTPATVADLQAELTPLQTDHAQAVADLAELTRAHDEAKANRDAYRPRVSTPRENELSMVASAADNAMRAKRDHVNHLEQLMAPLQQMLASPDRVATAQSGVNATADNATAAAKAVAKCQRTVVRLRTLLDDANAAYALERDAAAQEVLAAAREDRYVPTVAIDRAQVAALESALATAEAELAAAQASHTAAEHAHRASLARLHAAERDAAALELELATRAFAPVVARFRKLSGLDYWPGQDLRTHVYRAERSAA